MTKPEDSVQQITLRMLGVDLRCHVLSDGKRIVEADSIAELVKAIEGGGNPSQGELEEFARWMFGREG